MDKEWMRKSRLSKEYEDGVESFLNFAQKNVEDSNTMLCPCVKCGNLRKNNVKTIRAHLTYNGMDLTYHTWISHGERYESHTFSIDEDQESHGDHLEDADMVHDAYSENPDGFNQLLEEAEMPLYSGCNKFTKLSSIVRLYNLKASNGWSDASFTDLLALIGEMLPEDNILPSSLYEAKKSFGTLGMKYEKIHACINDCILYRNDHENSVTCPTCGLSRWKFDKDKMINEGVPTKVHYKKCIHR